ncbi:MGH1-like glycoside hydrolase domain-containing protein [Microtetraspora malaysiensis]|uniref:Mannosylglycerate hydrolase MGH1-like glycoside hydrolase domain-containing protein n=1 Tax=Microtetraspora malaysiensis TaxID=161358 RepID=A0ABW6STN9_9ACTN
MEGRPAVDDAALGRASLAVLDANWTGVSTVPAPGVYPHQWSLDSAFVAIGLARHDAARAGQELLSLLAGQWRTGMIPHIVFHHAGGYFPGPSMWRSAEAPDAPLGTHTSGLTQPPLHAYAVWRVWRQAADRDLAARFVRLAWPSLVAQHKYLETRDAGGAGLAAIVHPWESGMDDSPAWDEPLAASQAGRCGDGYHDRYFRLAVLCRDHGYASSYYRDEHPFAVEDPLFNGIWLLSCDAMARLASEVVGADPEPFLEAAARIRAALLDRLWDGAFYARDVRAGRLVPVCTIGGFGPMLDPGLPRHVVEALTSLLESASFMGAAGYPVPSCDIRAQEFDRGQYWRGPSWISTNWLLAQAAAAHGLDRLSEILVASTLRLVRQGGFRECFDPFDGTGRGCRDFSWSAALTLDLLGR